MNNSNVTFCPECGYPTHGNAWLCPICHSSLQLTGEQVTPTRAPFSPFRSSTGTEEFDLRGNPHTYSLATLFLVMTVICVGLGAIVAAPGLGIPFVVLAAPAFFRSVAAKNRAGTVGRSWTFGERVMRFLCSLGLMLLIAVAGIIAFQIACWTSCLGAAAVVGENEGVFLTGIWVGSAVGVWTIGWLLWRTWPKAGR